MARKHCNLPPLAALATFEAAARHASFKRAAAELNVTQGAARHQIKALEQDLGRALFKRTASGTLLTTEGRDLQQVLARSFRQTAAMLERLRQSGVPSSVTIVATTAEAALWHMPRISRFWRSFHSLRVNQHASDLESGVNQSHIDLRMRYGKGRWPDHEAALLFHDEIMPLCSASFAKQHLDPSLPDLSKLPLIHLEAEDTGWTTWQEWFGALGHEGAIDRRLVVNNHMIALQAAQDGNGICLGWAHPAAHSARPTPTPLSAHAESAGQLLSRLVEGCHAQRRGEDIAQLADRRSAPERGMEGSKPHLNFSPLARTHAT